MKSAMRDGTWLLVVAMPVWPLAAQQYDLRSPDGRIQVTVRTGSELTWSVAYGGTVLLEPSPLSLTIAPGRALGPGGRVARASRRSVDQVIRPVVPEKNAVVPDRFAELRLDFRGGWGLVVRAYDNGAAYRFTTSLNDSVTVEAEESRFHFAGNYAAWFPADSLWMSHQEPVYRRVPLDSLATGVRGLTPLVLEVENGPRLALMESALEDYPGMHLTAAGEQSLAAVFPPAALEEDTHDVRNVSVSRRAPYLARTVGTREYPWRVLAIASDDRALLKNQLVYQLAPELRLQDTSWIRPGKVAWDWWNDRNFHGVDFEAGINQRTYEEYVNFAREYGIPYVILDEGWSPLDSLMTTVPSMDVAALVRYAEPKGVGIILWALWKPLDDRMDQILDRWRQWGVRGVKVDFMQRDDQAMVRFYWRMAREAAERHMLVDFHGAYKPAGLRRAYPNVLTREGVRGLEADKWSADVTPDHDATLPFTRMLAGPMDYTPGAMINAARQEFRPIYSHPMSQGTRAHQMALYVVFESPLQMLADNPQHYRAEPEVTRFIAAVPVTWDETRPLLGKIGDYVAIARRKGDTWWVGAITDWEPRTLSLDLGFLGDRPYQMELYRDGVNAAHHGGDYARETRAVDGRAPLEVRLAPGGGWVARFTPGGP